MESLTSALQNEHSVGQINALTFDVTIAGIIQAVHCYPVMHFR